MHYPFWTNLTFFFVRLKILDFLHSHALLILTKSSKSKNQVVHEQKFKNLLSSTYLTNSEKIVFDLESEVMRGLGFIPTGGNILSMDFFLFSSCEEKYANIGIFVYFVKNLNAPNLKDPPRQKRTLPEGQNGASAASQQKLMFSDFKRN